MAVADDLKLAHRALAQAAGKLSLMISRKKVNPGELASAAMLAHEASVTLGQVRRKLIPDDPPAEELAKEEEAIQ